MVFNPNLGMQGSEHEESRDSSKEDSVEESNER